MKNILIYRKVSKHANGNRSSIFKLNTHHTTTHTHGHTQKTVVRHYMWRHLVTTRYIIFLNIVCAVWSVEYIVVQVCVYTYYL